MVIRYRIRKVGDYMLAVKKSNSTNSKEITPRKSTAVTMQEVKRAVIESNKKHAKMMRMLAK